MDRKDPTAPSSSILRVLDPSLDTRRLLDAIDDAVILCDLDGTIVFCNEAMTDAFGWPPERARGADVGALLWPKSVAPAADRFAALADHGDHVTEEMPVRCKDGSTRWSWVSRTLLRNPAGQPVGVLGIARDITLRRQAHEQVTLEREQLREVLRDSPAVIYTGRLDPHETTYISPNAVHVLGFEAAELLERPSLWLERIHPEDRDRVVREVERARGDAPRPHDYRYLHADGEYRWLRNHCRLTATQKGARAQVVGSLIDITERKKLELELEQFFALSLELLCVASTDGYFLRVNPAFTDTLGWPEDELLAHPYVDFVHPDDREATEAETAKLAAGGTTVAFENRFRTRDGRYMWFLWKSTSDPEQGRIYAGAREITARKEAEATARRTRDELERRVAERTKELHRSERQYRDVFEHAPLGIAQKTRSGLFLSANRALADILGYDSPEELIDISAPRDIYVDPADREAMLAEVEAVGRVTGREVQWCRKDGHLIWVRLDLIKVDGDDGEFRYLQVFVHDVTSERVLQDQLQQAQKMEAVGTLAGGIAHDFNNLLTPILANAEFLMDDLEPDAPSWQDAKEIRETAKRAMALTRQILTFARKQPFRPSRLDVSEVVSAVQPMLKHVIREDVRIRVDTSAEPCWVETDRGQLEQVLLNLVINARDAMNEGGEIAIETSRVVLDAHYTGAHAEVEAGSYALLAVSDTGHGMDEETRRRVFEPFFTTKGPDRGTGLGLSTVYAIVRRSGGHVQVYSEPGQGTVFRIYLPATEAAGEPEAESMPPSRPRQLGRVLTVLVVEDDLRVRASAARTLRSAGYRVLEAEDGEQAMDTLRAHPDVVQLLLTDVVMPGMSGVELAERARSVRPELAVVLMSGYTEATALRRGILSDEAPFLQKPFTPAGLQRKVNEVLEREGEAEGDA